MNTPKPIYINDPELVAQRDALLAVAIQIREDLKLRARFAYAAIEESGQPVVDVSNGIWVKFCETIAAVESGKVPT